MVTPQDALCTTSSSSPSATPCQFYLLLENSRKSNNLGPILRCAAAFGIHTVVAVGYDKCSVDGSHGASKHVRIIAFPLAEQAAAFLREECQCQSLIGLLGCLPDGYAEKGYPVQYNCCDDDGEGSSSSSPKPINHAHARMDNNNNLLESKCEVMNARTFPVDACPFSATEAAAIVISPKLKQGLSIHLALQCDAFIHVPHVAVATVKKEDDTNTEPTLLVDVPSSLSISLHHLTNKAGYNERKFVGHKFAVAPRRHTSALLDEDEEIAAKRRSRAASYKEQCLEQATVEGSYGIAVFETDGEGDY